MRILSIFIMLLVLSIVGHGQKPTYYLDPDKKLTQYNFDHWSTNNGLPTNSLLYIHQSSEGYLWITGYSGLIRYDGLKFRVFSNANTEVFNSNVFRNIAEGSDGKLWMTTQGNGLVSYAKGEFETYGTDIGLMHLYRGLLADSQGRIWAASPDKGWFYFDNGAFNFIESATPLNNIEVRDIAQSKTGAIWFATLGEGLFKYENGILKRFTETDGLISDWVYSLFVDDDDNLWVGTSKGICYYDGYRFHHTLPEITSTVNKIMNDRFGNIWIGTFNGLYRSKAFPRQLEHISSENGLANDFIVDMVFDSEGSLWITHYKGGITRVKDGKFTNYTQKGGLPGSVVNTVIETQKQTLLAGFDNGELIEIENGRIKPYLLKTNLTGNRIRHVLIDNSNVLWISTYFGLLKVSPNGTEKWHNEANGFFDTQIRLSFQDSKGNTWVGSRNNGVLKMSNNGSQTVYNAENGLLSNLVMAIEEDVVGNIWVGTSEGNGSLNKIDVKGNISSYSIGKGFESDIVFNIYPDPNGAVWFATVNGLWLYKNESFFNITTKQGLADNSVFDVVEDDLGYLWMPFDNGVMKVWKQDAVDITDSLISKLICRVYNKFDGMPNSECNPTTQSLKGSDGRLYFPTLDGLSVIDPSDEIINNFIPPVLVEEVIVDNRRVQLSDKMVFEPWNKRYTFNFTALSLYEPEKVIFRYQLSGFDEEWTETTQRSVSYTNLPHGNYSLNVIASNNDGVWNQAGAQLNFVIKPKFTETAFFNIMLLILSFISVFLIYIWRIDQYRKSKIELERIIMSRTREISDKNEALELQKSEIQKQNEILQRHKHEIEHQTKELEIQKEELNESILSKDKIFSIISHDLRSPLGNIKNMLSLLIDRKDQFDEQKRNRILENLAEITKSTFFLLDNLLSWSRSQRGLIAVEPQMFLVAPVVDEILKLTRHQSDKKRITILSHIDESDLAYGDINMIKTIFRNIIENSIKFTNEGGKVEITSAIKHDFIEFAFTDNGVGMTEEQVSGLLKGQEIQSTFGTNREKGSGLGLVLCKDFIHKNGGSYNVISKPGEGTTFIISLKRFQI